MLPTLRVARSVKTAVRLVQTRFQHIKDSLVPRHDFIAVAVFYGHTTYLVNRCFFVSSEAVAPLTEEHSRVVSRADRLYKLISPQLLQGIYDISDQRALSMSQEQHSPLTSRHTANAFGYGVIVHIRLSRTCRPRLDVPSVRGITEVFLLHICEHQKPPSILPRTSSSLERASSFSAVGFSQSPKCLPRSSRAFI